MSADSSTLSWAAGFTRHELESGGGTVSWLELTGTPTGTPVVLVHGMQGSALEHCELGRLLGTAGPVHALDLRAHGRSSAAPGNPAAGSIPDQVSVVTAFLREVVGSPAVLIGNSFGAQICARAAGASPELLERLVLIGPAVRPGWSPVEPKRFLQRLVARPRWVQDRFDADVRAGRRPEDPDTLVANATPYLELVPEAFLAAIRSEPEPAWSVADPAGRASLWRGRDDALVLMSNPRRWRSLLRSITTPALWLHGSDDPLMPRASADRVREQLPGWRVETIGGTGHVPMLERPEWTAERILAWLGRGR